MSTSKGAKPYTLMVQGTTSDAGELLDSQLEINRLTDYLEQHLDMAKLFPHWYSD